MKTQLLLLCCQTVGMNAWLIVANNHSYTVNIETPQTAALLIF